MNPALLDYHHHLKNTPGPNVSLQVERNNVASIYGSPNLEGEDVGAGSHGVGYVHLSLSLVSRSAIGDDTAGKEGIQVLMYCKVVA